MIKWLNDGGLSIDPPKKPKKITGTRFGAILNKSPWATPFEMWCEITKTYEEPFEDTIHTIAGKKIESKQIDYIKLFYEGVVTPEDIFGKNFFKITRGDFFPTSKYFGGMWDSVITTEDFNCVIECKTTKRAEDWENDIPEYYALQASLYAYLLGFDDVMMVCTVLDEEDYYQIDDFEVDSRNTFLRKFKVSERYPDFTRFIEYCTDWYEDTVLTGFSPIPTDRDADILKILHTEIITPDSSLSELISEFEELKGKIDTVKSEISKDESRLKTLSDIIKDKITADASSTTRFEIKGTKYTLSVSPSVTTSIDIDKLKADGLYENYKIEKPVSYRLKVKENK